jgi:conjugal transfer/entry exclusion protein
MTDDSITTNQINRHPVIEIPSENESISISTPANIESHNIIQNQLDDIAKQCHILHNRLNDTTKQYNTLQNEITSFLNTITPLIREVRCLSNDVAKINRLGDLIGKSMAMMVIGLVITRMIYMI